MKPVVIAMRIHVGYITRLFCNNVIEKTHQIFAWPHRLTALTHHGDIQYKAEI